MISQVTFWVEHGEDTDLLEEWIDYISTRPTESKVLESDFIVDVPSPVRKWFVNEEGNVYDYLPGNQAEHFPNDWHRAFDTQAEAQTAADDWARIIELLN